MGSCSSCPPPMSSANTASPAGRPEAPACATDWRRCPADADIICVHDAARPLANAHLFRSVIDAVASGADGAIPGMPVTDTIKIVDRDGPDVLVRSTPDRESLVAVQTPQAFRAAVLRAAHASGDDATDDAVLVERAGGRVVVVPSDATNRKITDRDDLEWARRAVEAPS